MTAVIVEDISEGTGALAELWRTLRFHYTIRDEQGTLLDHWTEQPFTFALIPDYKGWVRHLIGMRVGGRRRLRVPPGALGSSAPRAERNLTIEAHLIAVDEQPIRLSVWEIEPGDGLEASWGDIVSLHLIDLTVSDDVDWSELSLISWRAWAELEERDEPPQEMVLGAGMGADHLAGVVLGMRPGGIREVRLAPEVAGGQGRCVRVHLVSVQPAALVEA